MRCMAPALAAEIMPESARSGVTTAIQRGVVQATLGVNPAADREGRWFRVGQATQTGRGCRHGCRKTRFVFNEWSIRIYQAMDRAAQHGAKHVQLGRLRGNGRCRVL